MKAKNVQSIICLVIFFLFANQAWTAEWIYFDKAAVGDFYYDKHSIKKEDKNIISVWNKDILSKEAKTKYFTILKGMHKAPKNPSTLSYYKKLMQIDCANRKIKDISVIFYDEKGKVVYSSPKSETGEWNDILPDTVGEKLINIVSCEPVEPVAPQEAVAPKVEEPVAPKVEAPVASTVAVVTPKVEAPVASTVAVVAPKVEAPVAPKETVVVPKVEALVASKEAVVAPKVEAPVASKVEAPVTPQEAVASKEAVVFASVAADDLDQVKSNQLNWVNFYTSEMGNVTSYKKLTAKKG